MNTEICNKYNKHISNNNNRIYVSLLCYWRHPNAQHVSSCFASAQTYNFTNCCCPNTYVRLPIDEKKIGSLMRLCHLLNYLDIRRHDDMLIETNTNAHMRHFYYAMDCMRAFFADDEYI